MEVYVGEKLMGETPSLDALNLSPGQHVVTLIRKDYRVEKVYLNVKKGSGTILTRELTPLESPGDDF